MRRLTGRFVTVADNAGVTVVREVELGSLLELRARVLTPGHPNRPVTWWYDNESAVHYGMFIDDQLIGCVSVTPQEMPTQTAARPYHLHSMAIEPEYQGNGLGRHLLATVVEKVSDRGGDVIWATARPAAVRFYQRCGFDAGQEMRVQPTNAPMQYVWLVLKSTDPPVVTEAMAMSAITPYLPSPVTALTSLAGSVSNQDFMVHTPGGDFVLKIGDRRELSAEAWACERIRGAGVAGPACRGRFSWYAGFRVSASIRDRTMGLSRRVGNCGLCTPSEPTVTASSPTPIQSMAHGRGCTLAGRRSAKTHRTVWVNSSTGR